MSDVRYELAYRMLDLDKRVSRLETLEAPGGGGGGSGDLFLIETIEITDVAGGAIQFDTIPATAKHLFYTGFMLGNGTNMYMIINGGATATDLSNLGNFTCGFGGGATTINNVRMGFSQSQSSVGVPTDVFSAIWGWIPNPLGDLDQHLGTMSWSGALQRDDLISQNLWNSRGGGNWDRDCPITQINVGHDGAGGNTWEQGTLFSLYGLTG